MMLFNGSPEGRLLLRYIMMALLWMIATRIVPYARTGDAMTAVVWIGTVVSSRIVFVAPRRYAFARRSPGLRAVWYAFIAEIAVLAVAFVMALDERGNTAIAWTALAAAIMLDVGITRWEVRQHRAIGTVIPTLRPNAATGDTWEFTGESWGGANDAFKSRLVDFYPRVATVVRAYLALGKRADAQQRRILALRFAYPWSDDDALRGTLLVFNATFAGTEALDIIILDDGSERRLRNVCAPFYERAPRKAPHASAPADVTQGSGSG